MLEKQIDDILGPKWSKVLKFLIILALRVRQRSEELSLAEGGRARVDLPIDTAIALLDLEEARHAPRCTPWVGTEPVIHTWLSAVA